MTAPSPEIRERIAQFILAGEFGDKPEDYRIDPDCDDDARALKTADAIIASLPQLTGRAPEKMFQHAHTHCPACGQHVHFKFDEAWFGPDTAAGQRVQPHAASAATPEVFPNGQDREAILSPHQEEK